MSIVTTKSLYLERRGCEFLQSDPACDKSDVGNYRLVTPGYTVKGKNGLDYCIELSKCEHYRYITKNKNGTVRKHPKKELLHDCTFTASFCYQNERGCWGDLDADRLIWEACADYTEAGILEQINRISAEQYDSIIYCESFEFTAKKTDNFTPSTKIVEWANSHRLNYYHNYDETIVELYTGKYAFDHYEIKEIDEEREQVKIFLRRI